MRRSLPHDITNALAASALVLETGLAGRRRRSPRRSGGVHRPAASPRTRRHLDDVALVQRLEGDHAARRSGRRSDAFESIRADRRRLDKGVDLSPMAADVDRCRCGHRDRGGGRRRIRRRRSTAMTRSSRRRRSGRGRRTAPRSSRRPGDACCLSPGCASFDWYSGFEAPRRRLPLAGARTLRRQLHDQSRSERGSA